MKKIKSFLKISAFGVCLLAATTAYGQTNPYMDLELETIQNYIADVELKLSMYENSGYNLGELENMLDLLLEAEDAKN